jgi:hypothetical protein
MPVVLQGIDAAGRRFFDRAVVVSLDAHGGRVRTRFLLKAGAEVTIQMPAEDKPKRLRVIWRGETESFYEGMMGLEFVDPNESWDLESLRARWGARRF